MGKSKTPEEKMADYKAKTAKEEVVKVDHKEEQAQKIAALAAELNKKDTYIAGVKTKALAYIDTLRPKYPDTNIGLVDGTFEADVQSHQQFKMYTIARVGNMFCKHRIIPLKEAGIEFDSSLFN